jgi:hypothetical protein
LESKLKKALNKMRTRKKRERKGEGEIKTKNLKQSTMMPPKNEARRGGV